MNTQVQISLHADCALDSSRYHVRTVLPRILEREFLRIIRGHGHMTGDLNGLRVEFYDADHEGEEIAFGYGCINQDVSFSLKPGQEALVIDLSISKGLDHAAGELPHCFWCEPAMIIRRLLGAIQH